MCVIFLPIYGITLHRERKQEASHHHGSYTNHRQREKPLSQRLRPKLPKWIKMTKIFT